MCDHCVGGHIVYGGGGGESQLLKGKFNENKVHLPHAANRAERSYIDWGIEL